MSLQKLSYKFANFNCTTLGTIADGQTKNMVIVPNPGGSCTVTTVP